MARMYSRRKGKSGSHKPKNQTASWVKYKPAELEKMVVDLAKEGHSSAKVGLVLRDQYGIPTVRLSGLRVGRIMEKNGLMPELPEDLFNMVKRAVLLDKHLAKNKRDYISKRGLELAESKIRRLANYYKKNDKLPKTWKWNMEQAKLLIK